MTPEQWHQIREVLAEALELKVEDRPGFLDRACSSNDALRREVERLLSAGDKVQSDFLQSSSIRATLIPGTKLGDYYVQELLGFGGMGEVYRARDARLERDVAIKVLPASLPHDPDRLRRFEQEARAAAALNHPNILAVFQMGTYEGAPYLVSELLEGSTLREHERLGPVAVSKAVDYAIQTAHGLAAAHDKGIVHRDLKPENLFVTKDGRIKILDFGLAKLTRPEGKSAATSETLSQATVSGMVMGTVGYMSPEQIRGQSIDGRADIFSLGVVLYEMVAGRRPFEGATAIEVGSAILQKPPEPFPSDVPASLRRIVGHCIAKESSGRYQRAEELRVALEAILGEENKLGRSRPAVIGAGKGLAAGPIRSLVVLPLRNLSPNPDEEYFAEGVTEELTSALAQVSSLRVVSHRSAVHYQGRNQPLREIARKLKVEAAVEGAVLRVGDRVRITAQLIHAPADTHIWAGSYERDLRNVLALQTEIARAIANEIQVKLTPREQARLLRPGEVDPDAYRLYLKGRFHLLKWTPEGFGKGVEFFRQALEQDPSYALAYAGLAECYCFAGFYHLMPGKVVFAPAKAAARRALELDETLAETHVSMAAASLAHDWDWLTALAECRRAIELNPGHANAHHWYAIISNFCGRQREALAEMRHALDLDPLSLIIQTHLGWVFYTMGEYDQAIRQFQQALELDRNFLFAQWMLGQTYSAAGQHEKAIELIEKVNALFGRDPPVLAGLLGYNFAKTGRESEAHQLLAGLENSVKAGAASPYEPVLLCTGLNDVDQAFAWLETCYADRSSYLALLKIERIIDPLRSDPRFQDLVLRVNFPAG